MRNYSVPLCTVILAAAMGSVAKEPETVPPSKPVPSAAAAVAPVVSATQASVGATGAVAKADDTLPPDVIVQVNGHQLTLSAAIREVDILMANAGRGGSPQQLDQMRRQALRMVVDQFAEKALLLDEADRIGVTLTPEDESNAVANLQAMLPQGVSVEQAMRQSPLGEARFRAEMMGAARIKKLLNSPAADSRIPESDYAAFTNKFQTEIGASETVRARHILIATAPSDGEKEKEAKRKRAEAIREKLLKGADFAEVAKESSDCPSKEKGGDLGRFGRRKMVKPFADAAFAQKVGQIGDVVETQFGYHVIQVTERKTMEREDIFEIMRRQKVLEKLRKDARIKYNPPQQLLRRPAARPIKGPPGTNVEEGVLDVNPGSAP